VFYEEVFRKLTDREVKYVVAGGVAIVLHGVARLSAYLRPGDIEIPVISKKHLKALKRKANRPQDIADIEAIEEIEQMEHKDE